MAFQRLIQFNDKKIVTLTGTYRYEFKLSVSGWLLV